LVSNPDTKLKLIDVECQQQSGFCRADSRGDTIPGMAKYRLTAGGGTPADSGPTIFDALQEQLGLKLESSRGPTEVLLIESVEKPSEN